MLIYFFNGFLLLLGGQVLGHVFGPLGAFAALPHAFLELAAYAIPTAMLFFRRPLQEAGQRPWPALATSVALVLVAAGIEAYITQLIMAALLARR